MSNTAPMTVTGPLKALGALYIGTVMHARMKPVTHRFTYRVFSMLIDLDQLPALDRLSAVFSVNRFNLFSFYPADHGPRDGSSLALYARTLLKEAGTSDSISHVYLLCYPRMLGYAFNPLSVYFAYGADHTLLGVIYEVRNTFGEHHTYVAAVHAGELTVSGLRQERKKRFYVSPFNDLEMRYLFRLHPPDEKITVRILVTDEKCAILDARCERECVADKKGQTGAMFCYCRSDKPDWRYRGIRLTQSLTAHHSAYLHARLFITPLSFFKSVPETDRNRRFGTLYHPKAFEP